MAYQLPPDPTQSGAGPQYYAPPPPPGAKAPWPAWKWGCLIAGILGCLALIGGGICCGIPAYQYKKMGGMAGLMGMGWLANVATGQLDSAGALTQGGRPEAEKLAKKIEAQVGSISDFQPDMKQFRTETDKAAGTARVSLTLTGSKGSAECVLHMRQSPQTMWMVEDVTLTSAPGTESVPSP